MLLKNSLSKSILLHSSNTGTLVDTKVSFFLKSSYYDVSENPSQKVFVGTQKQLPRCEGSFFVVILDISS